VIHKSSGLLSSSLGKLSEESVDEYGILAIAAGLYEQYQNLMRSRDFIDYDDMIVAALQKTKAPALSSKTKFLPSLKMKLNSTPLQTRLWKFSPLTQLIRMPANLIRVGPKPGNQFYLHPS